MKQRNQHAKIRELFLKIYDSKLIDLKIEEIQGPTHEMIMTGDGPEKLGYCKVCCDKDYRKANTLGSMIALL